MLAPRVEFWCSCCSRSPFQTRAQETALGELRKQLRDLDAEKQTQARNLQRAEGRVDKEVTKASKAQQQLEELKVAFETMRKVRLLFFLFPLSLLGVCTQLTPSLSPSQERDSLQRAQKQVDNELQGKDVRFVSFPRSPSAAFLFPIRD